ncbi:MAG: carbohydrate ABC transporter substrate-binding protein [Thermomicrobiales bacterium]|nr:carbohydrate ABC transporter substrate-binding protein [Thermomicrobiales bacterium]
MFNDGSREAEHLIAGVISGRVSRRELMKRAAAIGLSAAAVGALVRYQDAAAQATGEVEIFSWWTSGGEAAALDELFKAFTAANPDATLINAAIAGGGGGAALGVLQTRLAGNNPPDSWQVHVGRELFDRYVIPGYTEPVTALYESEGWNAAMPQGLIDQVTVDGEKYAVPVGVHRGNGFWYNKDVVAAAGVEVGETMSIEEFLTAAEAIKATGVTPFAVGDKDAFVVPQNFENCLAAVAGAENYNKFFSGEMPWDDQLVKDAATVLGQMLDYQNDDHSALTWDGATALVIEGKAAFNAMGDWAYGEVVKKNAQETVGWVSTPGSAGSFLLVVDCFTLPKGAPNPDGATAWLKAIGTVEAQAAFNPLKGSIPARTDVPSEGFSDYHQWSMNSFANDALLPSVAHGSAAPPQFQQALYDAANAFSADRDVDAFVQSLVDAQSEYGTPAS